MYKLERPTIEQIYSSPALGVGEWTVAYITTSVGWPVKVTCVPFRGHDLFLIPQGIDDEESSHGDSYPAVAVKRHSSLTIDDAQILISHFLSTITWVDGNAIFVDAWGGGSRPFPMMGCSASSIITEEFYRPYLPDPQDQRTRWALAFYREGLALNIPAYKCLSFFKILNIVQTTSSGQKRWINEKIKFIRDRQALDRIQEIQTIEPDVGRYLYGSNRCAVAHAGGTHGPTADPESPQDNQRLSKDLILVRALAEIAIEREFGVLSSSTIYRQHLYELEGFRSLIGSLNMKVLAGTGCLNPLDWPQLPNLTIRLTGTEQYPDLEDMKPVIRFVDKGAVHLACVAENPKVVIALCLDFANERLRIDPFNAFLIEDDGSAVSAWAFADAQRFARDYLCNGRLELWSVSQDKLLGRCDAYLPTNVDMRRSVDSFNLAIEEFNRLAARRCGADTLG